MTHIGFTRVAWPYGIGSVGKRYLAIRAKIDDHLDLRVETMHMTRLVVHRVNHEPDAIEANRTHLFLY